MKSRIKDYSAELPSAGVSRRTFVSQFAAGSLCLAATRAMGKKNSPDKARLSWKMSFFGLHSAGARAR